MKLESLQNATWHYGKRIAQLVNNGMPLITIKFESRICEVTFDDRILHIKKWGFCRPLIQIEENGKILFQQQVTNFWGNRHEVRIGDRQYAGITRASMHYHVVYMNAGMEIVSYHQNSWKWNPPAEFKLNAGTAPLEDIILLLIGGYYTLRKLKQTADASVVNFVVISG
jgi:hypothetical protein